MAEPLAFTPEADLAGYLAGKDAVLVPRGYEKYLGVEGTRLLESFPGQIIECDYVMDEGSLLYLEAKIRNLLDEKQI